MLKWLGKIKWWKQRGPEGPIVHEFGQYLYKPVIARAISVVVDVSQAQVCNWVADSMIEICLNDEPLLGANWARRRLESGNYEIKITSPDPESLQGTKEMVWRFFIA